MFAVGRCRPKRLPLAANMLPQSPAPLLLVPLPQTPAAPAFRVRLNEYFIIQRCRSRWVALA